MIFVQLSLPHRPLVCPMKISKPIKIIGNICAATSIYTVQNILCMSIQSAIKRNLCYSFSAWMGKGKSGNGLWLFAINSHNEGRLVKIQFVLMELVEFKTDASRSTRDTSIEDDKPTSIIFPIICIVRQYFLFKNCSHTTGVSNQHTFTFQNFT